jgi:hypothetical protein
MRERERERERGREQRQSGEVLSDSGEGSATLIGIFFFFFLIPNTYQNSVVLVSVKNPNLSQNGSVLIIILIYIFFSPRGYFSNLSLPKRHSFDFSIHFDGNTNGGGQNATFW